MRHFMKRSFYPFLTRWCGHTSNTPSKQTVHTSRRAFTTYKKSRVKGLSRLTYEERTNPLKTLTLEKRLNTYPQVITQLKRKRLKRTALRLFHRTGTTRRRANRFTYRLDKSWNCLVRAVLWVLCQCIFIKLLGSHIYSWQSSQLCSPDRFWCFWCIDDAAPQ